MLFQTWYFGLCYTDSHNQPAWLIKSKKISKQDLKKDSVKKFQFKFKYFPENVADEVIQDNTMRMLYRQVPKNIKLISAQFAPNFGVICDKLMRVTLHFSTNYAKISFLILGPGLEVA